MGFQHFGLIVDLSHPKPFRTAYEPFHFQLTRFTTLPNCRCPYSFAASSDTIRRVTWAGTVTAQPPASSGQLRVEGIALPKYAPYLDGFTRAQLADGTLEVEAGYRFESGTNGTDLVVSNLAVTMAQLRLQDPDTGETVLAAPSYALRHGSFDLRARHARVGSLIVNEPTALARRRADGRINLPLHPTWKNMPVIASICWGSRPQLE